MSIPSSDGAPPPQPGVPPQGSVYPPPNQPYYPYPVYAPAPYGIPMRPQLPASPRAIWSMVLGIIGLISGFFIGYLSLLIPAGAFRFLPFTSSFETYSIVSVTSTVIPLAVSIVAVVLGHTSLTQIRRGMAGGQGYAITGIVLGYVSIGLRVLEIAIDVLLFTVLLHSRL